MAGCDGDAVVEVEFIELRFFLSELADWQSSARSLRQGIQLSSGPVRIGKWSKKKRAEENRVSSKLSVNENSK